jgi:ABC-type multidrug transport system fused ATPase/permease subunit
VIKTALKYLRWLYSRSEGVRLAIVANILMDSLHIGLNLVFIFLCKRMVDIATGVHEGNLTAVACITVGTILLRLLISALNVRLENLTRSRMEFLMRRRTYSHLLQTRWAGREGLHTGDAVNRIETDVSTVTGVICTDLPSFISTSLQLVAAAVFLCFMDWKLALIIVLATPFLILFSKLFFRKMRTLTRNIRDTESDVQSHIQESLRHKVVIQSLENSSMMEGKLDDLQSAEYGQVVERTRFNIIARVIVSATFSFGYIAAFLWGVFGIWKGSITFGMMTAFLQLVGQIQRPAVNLTRQVPAFIYATASMDRLMELEQAPKEESGEQIQVGPPAGVRLEWVTFRYPDGDENVLEDISFDFSPGSKTAIVGHTGAGKSTIIRLILGLLAPDKGRITIYSGPEAPGGPAEVDASPMTRCNIVYVPQGNTLFSGSVRENLLMGDPDASEERLREMLEKAEATFVFDLPDGLDTPCGEGGAGLSEGQAQRIAIARGLLRPGSIMLLDEFSSSLDPATEDRLMQNLGSDSSGKTMIFITHREHIAEFCSNILKIG